MPEPFFLPYLPHALLREVEDGRAAVVGGAVRCCFDLTDLHDIDVFIFSEERYKELVVELSAKEKPGTDGMIHTVPGKIPVEIIHFAPCDSVKGCMENADFDIASGLYCEGKFFLPPGYQEAIKNRVMRFLRTATPEGSYARYMKYAEYGYRIDSSINLLLAQWEEESK